MGKQYDYIQGFDISNLLLWNLICDTTRLIYGGKIKGQEGGGGGSGFQLAMETNVGL